MGIMGGFKVLVAWVVVSVVAMGVGAQVHHVVGGERGWNPSSDLRSWSSGRIFTVGDKIWFTYSAAQEENIVELQSMEEYLSCDVSNPIRMYTDGFNKVSLDEEGIRYFASGNLDNCKNGLKLHVQVAKPEVAAGPTPSASTRLTLTELPSMFFGGMLLCYTYMAL